MVRGLTHEEARAACKEPDHQTKVGGHYSLTNVIMMDKNIGSFHKYLRYCHKRGAIVIGIQVQSNEPTLYSLAVSLSKLASSSRPMLFIFAIFLALPGMLNGS